METIKIPEFNNIFILSPCEKEITKLKSGFSKSKKFELWLLESLRKLDDPEIDCSDFPRRFEPIQGNIYCITYRNKEKNIRILYNNSNNGVINILLCAFDEKKDSDYALAIVAAKKRLKYIKR